MGGIRCCESNESRDKMGPLQFLHAVCNQLLDSEKGLGMTPIYIYWSVVQEIESQVVSTDSVFIYFGDPSQEVVYCDLCVHHEQRHGFLCCCGTHVQHCHRLSIGKVGHPFSSDNGTCYCPTCPSHLSVPKQ